MTKKSNSEKAFKYSLVTAGLFIVFMVVKALVGAEKIDIEKYGYISAFIMFMVVLFSIIGFIYNMKGLKDPKSIKKIVGLVLNTMFMVLFLTTTIANIIDLIKYSKLY